MKNISKAMKKIHKGISILIEEKNILSNEDKIKMESIIDIGNKMLDEIDYFERRTYEHSQ